MTQGWEDAHAIAASVHTGHRRATAVVENALVKIAREDARYNTFTQVLVDQARADATRIDNDIAAGKSPGPLAGVPFAVKNLFDIAGLTTCISRTCASVPATSTRLRATVFSPPRSCPDRYMRGRSPSGAPIATQ